MRVLSSVATIYPYILWLAPALLALWAFVAFRALLRRYHQAQQSWGDVQEALWHWHMGVRALLDEVARLGLVDEATIRYAREAQAGAARANGPLVQSESHDLLTGALGPVLSAVRRREAWMLDSEALQRLTEYETRLAQLGMLVQTYNDAAERCSPSTMCWASRLMNSFIGQKRPARLRGSITHAPDSATG